MAKRPIRECLPGDMKEQYDRVVAKAGPGWRIALDELLQGWAEESYGAGYMAAEMQFRTE